jgi:hypothetical protein
MAADCNFARFKPQGKSPVGARKMLSAEEATLLIEGSGFGDY